MARLQAPRKSRFRSELVDISKPQHSPKLHDNIPSHQAPTQKRPAPYHCSYRRLQLMLFEQKESSHHKAEAANRVQECTLPVRIVNLAYTNALARIQLT